MIKMLTYTVKAQPLCFCHARTLHLMYYFITFSVLLCFCSGIMSVSVLKYFGQISHLGHYLGIVTSLPVGI